MRKITARTLSLFLALLFVITAAYGCGGKNGEDGAVTTAPVDDKEELELEARTFGGEEFRVLLSGLHIGKLDDFGDKENKTGYATVSQAVHTRDLVIEATYGVDIVVIEDFGSQSAGAAGVGPGFNAVAQDYLTGDCSYDLCEVSTYDAAKLALNGYLYDIASMPNINLSKSWWDQKTAKDLTVKDKLFYTTGDISVSGKLATHCLLFNKTLATENQITDLYDLVKTGKWTLDKFMTYARTVSSDVDGNGVRDASDKYGLLTWNDSIQSVFAGGGSRIATVGEDGAIYLSLFSEKNVDLFNQFTAVAFDGDYTYNYTVRNSSNEYDKVRGAMFDDNRALFYATCMNTVPKHRDSNVDFGILPFPKYDEAQENYGSYVAATYSVMLCVEANNPDLDRTGYLMEAIAYQSKKSVTPAYYQQTLIGRYTRDDESVASLDIIFATRSFDVGVYYRIGDYTGQMTNMMKRNTNNFVTFYDSYKLRAETEIEEINTQFAAWIQ